MRRASHHHRLSEHTITSSAHVNTKAASTSLRDDAAYKELLRISKTTPVVFLTTLERPLILTDVKPHATVLLGDFGISDAPLFALLTGKVRPTTHLPFELPSSEAAVRE